MSFFDDASLVFLPSGEAGKDGKAYSMKPTNGNGDFTFSRGSNLTATRVDSNGLIEKGRENLLLQSNQFDTTWTFANVSATSGQSGYDGSNDAWKITSTNTGQSFVKQIVSNSGVATCSVYAKADTANFIVIYAVGGGDARTFFDLQNGTTEYALNHITNKIEDVGNGWYKCSVIFNKTISDVRLFVADSNNVYNSGNGSSIYIQDAQLEQGLAATEYIESGATTGLGGLLEDSPRFDYSGGASCPSLLLEPSRTNLIDYSEAIEFGISTNECTQTITNQTNPSGNNVSYLASAIDSVNDQMRYDKNGLSSGSYFLSAFVKGDGNTNRIRMRGTGGGVTIGNVYWDVAADGTTTLNTSLSPSGVNAITEDYGDGWYRIGFEETFDGSSTSRFAIYPSNGDVNALTYIWGVQWEQGSYPTSYIPNHSGGSATREADVISKDLTSVINNSQMTMFVDVKSLTSITTIIAADDFGDLRWYHQAGNRFRFYKIDDADWLTNSFVVNDGDKIALTLTDTQAKLFVNGAQVGTTFTLTTSFQRFSNLNYNVGSSKNEWNQLLFFSTPLSDSECITLTS